MPHKRPPRQHQVWTRRKYGLVYQEILLLPAQETRHMAHLGVEIAGHPRSSAVDAVQRTQQRRLVVKAFARVRDEHRRYAQRAVKYERWRRNVPRRIAASLESVAYAAIGEARSVRLLLYQHLAAEPLDNAPLAVMLYERVMLLRRAARQRMKPVGVMPRTAVYGPPLHAVGNDICSFA